MLNNGEDKTGMSCVTDGFDSPNTATSSANPQSINPNGNAGSNRRCDAIATIATQAAISCIVSNPLEAGKWLPIIPLNVNTDAT